MISVMKSDSFLDSEFPYAKVLLNQDYHNSAPIGVTVNLGSSRKSGKIVTSQKVHHRPILAYSP